MKEEGWLIMDLKMVLMNVLKIYLIIQFRRYIITTYNLEEHNWENISGLGKSKAIKDGIVIYGSDKNCWNIVRY